MTSSYTASPLHLTFTSIRMLIRTSLALDEASLRPSPWIPINTGSAPYRVAPPPVWTLFGMPTLWTRYQQHVLWCSWCTCLSDFESFRKPISKHLGIGRGPSNLSVSPAQHSSSTRFNSVLGSRNMPLSR